jgi:hypothetical protein
MSTIKSNSQQALTPSQVNYAQPSQWKEIVRQAISDLRVAAPAIIEEFDVGRQVATVQIAITEVVRNPVTGPVNTTLPLIYNVPVVLPRAGGFSLTLPLKKGDECLLIFSDNCFDLWWTRGGVQDQFERRRHDLTDCFCVPGPWSQPRVISDYSPDSAELRSDDGSVVVEVRADEIKMKSPKVTIVSTGDVNITGNHVTIASTANDTKVDGKTFLLHEHSGVTSGGGNSGPVV